jgi:carboxypeptidase PM20D1
MILLWLMLGLLVLLIAVILIRAAFFRAADEKTGPFAVVSNLPDYQSAEAAGRFAELIRCRTIHPERAGENWLPDDYSEFARFRELLEKFYPLIHQQMEWELVNDHSLLYRWPGQNSEGPLVLMAHYDVVPAEDEQWTHLPFSGEIIENQVWGRGALDTKCTLFGIMEAAEALLKDGFTPKQDLYFAFGHDEETMGAGAPAIVELLKGRSIRPRMVVDEGGAIIEGVFPGVKPPIAVVGLTEKGLTDIEFTLEGSGGHASTPDRINPLAVMSKVVLQLDKNPFPASMPVEVKEMFTVLGKQMPFGLRIVFANLWCFKPLLMAALPLVGRELNALCRTTCVFTMAEASKAANVIPDRVRMVANLRLAATENCDQALAYVTGQAVQATARARQAKDPLKLKVKRLYGHDSSPSTSSDSAAYKKLVEVVDSVFQNVLVTPYIMLGASDSRHFCAICDQVLRFSPLKMSKEELRSIHGINEKISFDQLSGVVAFYYKLIHGS